MDFRTHSQAYRMHYIRHHTHSTTLCGHDLAYEGYQEFRDNHRLHQIHNQLSFGLHFDRH